MNILLINPATSSARKGNHVTSDRWKRRLETLGHTVHVQSSYTEGDWDALVALHAYKSLGSIEDFTQHHPDARVIVALTGTDVYRDLDEKPETRQSLELADELVVLQELARNELPEELRDKAHVVHQSVENRPETGVRPNGTADNFIALTVAHLRDVKDPLRLAYAVERLPDDSTVKAYHLGAVLEDDYHEQLEEVESSARFKYLGEKPRDTILEFMKGADVLVVPSRLEGGANVVSEAIAVGTPVLASDIPGNRGLLGDDYPGYFPVGDTEALTELLIECERRNGLMHQLQEHINAFKKRVEPSHEQAQWRDVLQSQAEFP